MKIFLLRNLTIVLFLLKAISADAQNIKKDTSFYLIDSSAVPVRDRMISIQKENKNSFLTINCPCLQNSSKPVFRFNHTKKLVLNKGKFNRLKLVKLTDLILLVKNNDNPSFDNQHVIYFIEPDKQAYAMYKAFFLGATPTVMN